MRREPRMFFSDPFNSRHDRAGHTQSCPLRGGTGTPVASSAPDCPAKLVAERFDVLLGFGDALGISELFGFFEFFAELFKPTALGSLGLRIKRFARVFGLPCT